jgi:hypothetical protein
VNQAVTELIVRGRTEGVAEARAEVEALERAHVKAQETTEKATLGLERMSARVQSRLDPQFRATQQLAKVEADLDLLRSKGLITLERQNALMALAAQRYGVVGTAAAGAAVGMAAPGQAAQLSAFQMQNLSFQMNDIASGLAMGQSPLRIMAQQGGQIVQIFGSGTGVVAAVKAAGSAMATFLLNPLTLAALGFGLALEVGMRFFSSVSSGASDAEKHLERHKDLIDRIGDAWPEAAGKMREYARESRSVLDFLRRASRDDLAVDVQAEARRVLDQTTTFLQRDIRGDPVFRVNSDFEAFAPAIDALRERLREGTPDIAAFREEVQRLADLQPNDAALRAAGAALIAMSDAGFDAERGLDAGTAALDRMSASAERAAKDLGKALDALRGLAVPKLSERDQAGALLGRSLGSAGALSDIAERRSAVETAVREYEAALERITAAERKAGIEALGDLQFKLDTMHLSDYARGLAEINREYDLLIAKAREAGADTTLLERRRGIDLQAFDASREAEFNELIAERRRALGEEAGALGLSETALAKYRTEIELTNAAMRLFGAVSPEMAAQIRALGDAAAAAVAAQARMAEQIAAMDALRGDVRGFLGDFVTGLRQGESAADALTAALNRLLDRLINSGLDMIVAGLFGQQGTAGGGLLGGGGGLFSGLFGGLFGGGGGGARASGPVPVTIAAVAPNLGAPGGASGGYIAANGLDLAAGGLRISPLGGGAQTRGMRNNNPGNIEFGSFAQSFGATGGDPRFAVFPSLDQGVGAMQGLLQSYGRRGFNTIDSIVGRWAPAGENNVGAYANFVSGQTGFGRDQTLDLGNQATLDSLTDAMVRYESGVTNVTEQITAGAQQMVDATGQAADTLSAGLPKAANEAVAGAEQLSSGVGQAGRTAQDAAGQFSGTFPGALQQVIQSIASGTGGAPFGGFPGGNFFGTFLGGGGFGGAPGFTPGVVMSRHRGGVVGDLAADNDNALRLASPAWFRNAVRAHGGLNLAPDERPIIAQTGERVLSRAETTAFEQGRHRGGRAAAPSVTIRTGDTILNVASDVPEKTRRELQAMLEDNNARQSQELKATFGEYQNSYATLKAG